MIRMTTKEKYNLHTDITGNCFIVGDDCKFGMFDKLERSQVIRVIDELNSQDERIRELETVVQDIVYETKYTVGKNCGEVCVFVSPQVYKRLTELLKEKIKW